MAKQLNINLGFNVDTSQASAAINKLSAELMQLGKTPTMSNLPITNELVEAQMAAKELAGILQSSLNVNTGQFDLSKFNTQLQTSGKNSEEQVPQEREETSSECNQTDFHRNDFVCDCSSAY